MRKIRQKPTERLRAFLVDARESAMEEEWLGCIGIYWIEYSIFSVHSVDQKTPATSARKTRQKRLIGWHYFDRLTSQMFSLHTSRTKNYYDLPTTFSSLPGHHREFFSPRKISGRDVRRSSWRIVDIPSCVNVRPAGRPAREVIIPTLFRARAPYRAKPGNCLSMVRTLSE